jgi:hypothetical protein
VRRRSALATSDQAVRHVEYVETSLDKLIEQRARGSTAAADRAKLWRESEETYHQERVEARTYQWISHHQRLSAVHRTLSEEHASKAAKLLSAGLSGGEVGR